MSVFRVSLFFVAIALLLTLNGSKKARKIFGHFCLFFIDLVWVPFSLPNIHTYSLFFGLYYCFQFIVLQRFCVHQIWEWFRSFFCPFLAFRHVPKVWNNLRTMALICYRHFYIYFFAVLNTRKRYRSYHCVPCGNLKNQVSNGKKCINSRRNLTVNVCSPEEMKKKTREE